MKAVNLLPEKHRPRKPTGGQGKSGYIFLGALGAVLIGVLVYVLTLNSINSSKTKITEATVEAARLNDQANSLGPYGDFAKIKAERVASVKQLAEGRFDYERMVRELAHVLPADVWLVNASASSVGDPSAAPGTTGSAAPATPAAPGGPAAPAPAPSLKLQGCARDQGQVAVTLVRLRELEGATDVSLSHSTAGQDNSTSGSGPAPVGANGTATGGGDQSCGDTNGKPNYSFEADVTFAPQTSSTEPGNVPRRLGGGA
jgi:Tfp pilus assembly protein PilN